MIQKDALKSIFLRIPLLDLVRLKFVSRGFSEIVDEVLNISQKKNVLNYKNGLPLPVYLRYLKENYLRIRGKSDTLETADILHFERKPYFIQHTTVTFDLSTEAKEFLDSRVCSDETETLKLIDLDDHKLFAFNYSLVPGDFSQDYWLFKPGKTSEEDVWEHRYFKSPESFGKYQGFMMIIPNTSLLICLNDIKVEIENLETNFYRKKLKRSKIAERCENYPSIAEDNSQKFEAVEVIAIEIEETKENSSSSSASASSGEDRLPSDDESEWDDWYADPLKNWNSKSSVDRHSMKEPFLVYTLIWDPNIDDFIECDIDLKDYCVNIFHSKLISFNRVNTSTTHLIEYDYFVKICSEFSFLGDKPIQISELPFMILQNLPDTFQKDTSSPSNYSDLVFCPETFQFFKTCSYVDKSLEKAESLNNTTKRINTGGWGRPLKNSYSENEQDESLNVQDTQEELIVLFKWKIPKRLMNNLGNFTVKYNPLCSFACRTALRKRGHIFFLKNRNTCTIDFIKYFPSFQQSHFLNICLNTNVNSIQVLKLAYFIYDTKNDALISGLDQTSKIHISNESGYNFIIQRAVIEKPVLIGAAIPDKTQKNSKDEKMKIDVLSYDIKHYNPHENVYNWFKIAEDSKGILLDGYIFGSYGECLSSVVSDYSSSSYSNFHLTKIACSTNSKKDLIEREMKKSVTLDELPSYFETTPQLTASYFVSNYDEKTNKLDIITNSLNFSNSVYMQAFFNLEIFSNSLYGVFMTPVMGSKILRDKFPVFFLKYSSK